jgi:hypothetical protein
METVNFFEVISAKIYLAFARIPTGSGAWCYVERSDGLIFVPSLGHLADLKVFETSFSRGTAICLRLADSQ